MNQNPFIVLGVPYGASVKEATQALARKTLSVKNGTDTTYSLDELTSALHAIEVMGEEYDEAYRIPSNPDIIKPKFKINLYEELNDSALSESEQNKTKQKENSHADGNYGTIEHINHSTENNAEKEFVEAYCGHCDKFTRQEKIRQYSNPEEEWTQTAVNDIIKKCTKCGRTVDKPKWKQDVSSNSQQSVAVARKEASSDAVKTIHSNSNNSHSYASHSSNYKVEVEPRMSKLAIWGLVMLFIFWPAGIIMSIVAHTRIEKGEEKGIGFVIASYVLMGIFSMIFVVSLGG